MACLCCKIGCTSKECDIVSRQEIMFRNEKREVIKTHILWCKEHTPECILDDFTHLDSLRESRGMY